MKIALITTTINYPDLLIEYAKDTYKYKRENVETIFIIAGDIKTPHKTHKLAKNIEYKYKIKTEYLDVEKQNKYLTKFKLLNKYLKWNSVQRRNVAFLRALEKDSDIIITIDDDNFLKTKNFVNKHLDNIQSKKSVLISSKNNWANICDFIKEKHNNKFFHRGFPVSQRKEDYNYFSKKVSNKKIVVNAGLWLGDPDIDAITRLSSNIVAERYKLKHNIILDTKTNSPFNSQNTALLSEVAPCYFLSSDVGRMDDIYASYITKKVCDHLDYYISFGEPIVVQKRNDHNIWKDLDLERYNHEYVEDLLIFLKEISLSKKSNTPLKTTKELISKLLKKVKKIKNKNKKRILERFLRSYLIWLKTIQILKKF